MEGLLLIDKPPGWTSHDAVAYVRKTLGEKKSGHTGTLDPDATGLLLVLLGRAARLARYFDGDDKEYVAEMELGAETDTQDACGKIIKECPVPALDERDVKKVFSRFTGDIEQMPPMYSAIKVGGRPLYKQARAGMEVERSTRKVQIKELELLALELPVIRFRVLCSKGTYIRTLCRDMGEALGSCAHMASLRRTKTGQYKIADAVGLSGRPSGEELLKKVTPLDELLPDMPRAVVSEKGAEGVSFGKSPREGEVILMPGGLGAGQPVRVMDGSGRLLAIGEAGGHEGVGEVRLKVVLV